MDLAQLKAQNATEEEKSEASPQSAEDELETGEGEEESEEFEQSAETDEGSETPEDTEESKLEDWQKADDDADPTFDNSDMAAVRRKYKGKLERANEDHVNEVQQLRADLEELRRGKQPPVKGEPNRDNYDDDLTYLEDRQLWISDQTNARQHATQASNATQARQLEAQRLTNNSVDEHYTRVDKLVADDKNDITHDLYYNSDLTLRKAVENIMPKGGDMIIDHLISNMGSDSEKVMYSLGVNKNKLGKFIDLLKSDPNGIKASMYLGELRSGINAPSKRKTKAPAPAAQAKGDKQLTGSAKSQQKAYDKADLQGRINIKRAAKQAGVDVSNW